MSLLKNEVLISVNRLNPKGWGIGTSAPSAKAQNGEVVVFGGLPGDELSVLLRKKRRGKWQGDLCSVVQASPQRTLPRCSHVSSCGGCTWQQMDYKAQVQEKQRRVQALFAPLLNASVQILPMISSENPWEYRNKMEFSFSQNRLGEKFLGLMIAGSKGHVLNLSECHLVSSWYAKLLAAVRSWWGKTGLSAYRLNGTGVLRTLTVREGKRTGSTLVMLTVSGNPNYPLSSGDLKGFIEAVKSALNVEEHPHLSIFLRIQQAIKGEPTQFFEMHLCGPDHLLEEMHLDLCRNNLKNRDCGKEAPQNCDSERATMAQGQGASENRNFEEPPCHSPDSSGYFGIAPPLKLKFKISPTSFFQPNTLQAEKLYTAALQMVSFPKRHVLDLYAGGATLGMAMATHAEKVTAIEINPYSCFDALSNQELNQLSNFEICCGDVGEKLAEMREKKDFIPPDLIVVDPPRGGLDKGALKQLLALAAKEILYISCNPETQAANIHELASGGYQLTKMQSVDQFHHTPHIENIALLSLR